MMTDLAHATLPPSTLFTAYVLLLSLLLPLLALHHHHAPTLLNLACPLTAHPLPSQDMTALMKAADRGRIEVAKTLLDAGADHAPADVNGWTALIYAAEGGNFDVLKALVDAGADPAATMKDGQSVGKAAGTNYEMKVCLMQSATGKYTYPMDEQVRHTTHPPTRVCLIAQVYGRAGV